jgi:predicted nucleotidyltransferase
MTRSRRLLTAQALADEFRRKEGRNLIAVGVYGSVPRGDEREHSDIDMLVVVRRRRPSIRHHVRDGVLVTILQHTPAEAREEVMGSRPDLNDALGGWRSLRPLYDPHGLLADLKRRARRPSRSQFSEAARQALLETFEDLGKLRNAIRAGDRDEAREMAIWFTGGAMGVLNNLDARVLETGRRAFIELRGHGDVDRAIRRLRYETLSLPDTEALAERVWRDLLSRAERQGIPTPERPSRTSPGSL